MNSKISAFQFYSLLFLTRLLTTLTYIPEYTKDITVSDLIFQPIFRFIFGVIITLPLFYFNEKYKGKVGNGTGKWEKIRAVIFTAVFFWFAVATVSRLDLFAGTVVFPETDVRFMLLFVVAICAYGAYLGLEPIARSAVMFSVPVILSLIFIFVSLSGKIDLLNLSPLFYNGVTPVADASIRAAGRTAEYAVIAVSLPFVTGNSKKGFYIWLAVLNIVTAVIFFFEAAVLGKFTEIQLFPVYSLASLAELSFFHGLEAIITGVWVLCAFLKISLLIYLQARLLHEAFGVNKKTTIFVSAVLLAIICLFVSVNTGRFKAVDSSIIKLIMILIAVPLLSCVQILFRRVKKCEKQL